MTIELPWIETAAPVPASARPALLWDLVEESFDEAAFLWGRFEEFLSSHERDLAGVAFWVEERLLGSLDGVRVAEQAAHDPLLSGALQDEDALRVTAAAHLLASDPNPGAIDLLVSALGAAAPEGLPPYRRALELTRSDVLLARLERDFAGQSPELLAMLIDVRAFKHGEPGALVSEALGAGHLIAQAAAVRALRHLPAQRAGRNAVVVHLNASDPTLELAAIETGLILGVPAAWMCLVRHMTDAKPAARLFLLAALLGGRREQAALVAALGDETLRTEALFALGFAGTKAAAEACLEAMKQEPLAKLAAEAFCAITGLDLGAEHLIAPGPIPEREEPVPFEEDDLDADLVPSLAEALPRPDVAGVARWWAKNAARLVADRRHLRGRPIDLAVLQHGLGHEPMRRRHALALELAIRTGGRYQVQTRAFTAEQKRQMSAFEKLGGPGMARSPLAQEFSPL